MINESVSEILSAAKNSKKISAFINGVDLELYDGKKITIKVVSSKKIARNPGFRFSRYSFVSQVTVNNDFALHSGFGEGNVEFIALQKSIAEAVERAVFRVLKKSGKGTQNTNAWSVHVNVEKAYHNSLEELAERDAVLVHWLRQISMTEVDPMSFPNWLKTWVAQELKLAPRFNQLRIGISNVGWLPTVTTVLCDDAGYAVASHATAETFEKALNKAINETCRIAELTLDNRFYESSYGLFMGIFIKDEPVQPENHAMVYAYHMRFPTWFFSENISWKLCSKEWAQKYKAFKKESLDFKFNVVTQSPLVIGYGESPKVQNLFIGSTFIADKQGLINDSRLKKIGQWWQPVNMLPHCIA